MDMKSRLRRMLGEGQDARKDMNSSPRTCSIPGEALKDDLGSYWLRICDFPLNRIHGRRRIEEVLAVDGERLATLTGDARLEAFTSKKSVFIDTETTSLAGGAGVYVFMAGVGFLHGNRFRIEQYFMRDYDEEPPMLSAFNRRVRGFDSMVSFFGKNFDRYRLEDRMNLLGIASALPVDRHLDLYHLGRRLYKGRFKDLKLKTLETSVLGFEREGDIPGAECPEAYFRYLRGEDQGMMSEVFEHNLWDILSLVALASEADALALEPKTPLDRYALGCVYMKEGLFDKALPLLEKACEDMLPGPEVIDAHLRLVRVLKKTGRRGDLEGRLNRLKEIGSDHSEVLMELAKFHEHISKDSVTALQYARRALSVLERADDGSAAADRRMKDAMKRIHRLQRKTEAL